MVDRRVLIGFFGGCIALGLGLLLLITHSDGERRQQCETSCAALGQKYLYGPAAAESRYLQYLSLGECRCVADKARP